MGDCFNLPENAHVLLGHLTKTKGRRKGVSVVTGDLDGWSEATGIDRESLRLAFEDLTTDDQHRWLSKDAHGRWVINVACACRVAGQTGPVIGPPSVSLSTGLQLEAQSEGVDVRKVASPPYSLQGSALQITRSERYSESTDDEADQAAERFLNGASAEAQPPARRMSPTQELVDFFKRRIPAAAKRQGITVMPTAISGQALGGQIRRMLQGGMDPDEVREMIILFGQQYGRFHKAEADPAKVFLAHRRRLYKLAQDKKHLTVERDPERFARQAAKEGRRYSTLEDMTPTRRRVVRS